MTLWRRFGVLAAMVVMITASTAVPGLADDGDDDDAAPIQLALGDSWAYGQGSGDPATAGYVAQLYEALQVDLDCLPAASKNAADGCAKLELVNFGRPGTTTMPGVTAPLVLSEQIPQALPLLAQNHDANPRNDVEVITLHVGGNDVTGPVVDACLFGGDCFGTIVTEVAAFEADLRAVMDVLRPAAGDDTPIVLGTYDNTVPWCFLNAFPGAVELGAVLLEGTPDGAIRGIHDVIRDVAADFDAEVAEVFGALVGPGDFVGGADCLHPSATGHDTVTEAFEAALGL